MQHILLVSQAFDPHTDELLVLLRYLGQEPIRLNTEAVPAHSLLSYTLQPGDEPQGMARASLLVDGRLIEVQQIGAVWWRQPAPAQFVGQLSAEELALARAETEQALAGFWLALEAASCLWVSRREAIAAARNLPEQIRRAAHAGFAVPRTLLTTRPGDLRTLWEATRGRLVYRLLSSLQPGLPVGERAVPITEQALAAFEERVSIPCLFQEQVPARQFLYVVVIGEQLFAAGSQEEGEGLHWWSPGIARLSYEPIELEDAVARQVRALVQSYGLTFAVVTLARGRDEQLYFASLDPVGAFLWLEAHCPDLPLRETLARHLLKGARA